MRHILISEVLTTASLVCLAHDSSSRSGYTSSFHSEYPCVPCPGFTIPCRLCWNSANNTKVSISIKSERKSRFIGSSVGYMCSISPGFISYSLCYNSSKGSTICVVRNLSIAVCVKILPKDIEDSISIIGKKNRDYSLS